MHISHIEKDQHIYTDVTGVLLAGGKSRPMGQDKALLQVDGKTLFESSLGLLMQFFSRIMIAGDRPDLEQPGILSIADIYPGSALGGLHTGLSAAATDWIFVAPCDMPYPDARITERLLAERRGVDAVVPRTHDGYEPVFALYHKNCLAPMESMLRQNQFRIYDFYQQINIRYLDPHELPGGWERALLNLNTPEQLTVLLEDDQS